MGEQRLRGGRAALLVLLGYVLLSALVRQVLWPDPLHAALERGEGDTGLFVFFLANTAHAVWHAHGHGLLVTHALNHPDGVNVLWNTSLLLPGLLLSGLTELAGPILVQNLLVVLGPALSAWSACLCSGRYLTSRLSRWVTGLAFGFSPAMMVEGGSHLHLSLLVLVPPILLLVVDLAAGLRPVRRTGAWLGALAAAQVLIGEEVLALTAVAVAVLLVVLGVQRPRQVRPGLARLAGGGAVAAGVLVLLVGWPLWVQFTGDQSVHGELQAHDVVKLDPAQLVTAPAQLRWHASSARSLQAADGTGEMLGYVGVPMLLLAAAAAAMGRRLLVVRTALVSALLLVVLAAGSTLRLNGRATGWHLPWGLTDGTPVLANVLPVRWMLLVDLLLALVLGVTVEAVGRRRRWAAPALAAVVLLPWLPVPQHAQRVPVPQLFADGAPGLAGAVLVVPESVPPLSLPMTWQAVAGMGFAMPGGYFVGPGDHGEARFGSRRHSPVGRLLSWIRVNDRMPVVTPALRRTVLEELARLRVTAVVLGPAPQEATYLRALTALLGDPVPRGETWVWARPAASPPRSPGRSPGGGVR